MIFNNFPNYSITKIGFNRLYSSKDNSDMVHLKEDSFVNLKIEDTNNFPSAFDNNNKSFEIKDRLIKDEEWIIQKAYNLYFGINCTKNKEESNKLLGEMNNTGNKLSKIILYLNGDLDEEMNEQEIQHYLGESCSKECKTNMDSISIHLLGVMNENKGDLKVAIEYYQIAAELGNACSLNNLAELYLGNTNSVKRNMPNAIKYFEKASELGNSDSMFHLYKIYSHGISGVERNFKKALEYLEKASEVGDEDATFILAQTYEKGNDIKKNINKALYFYQKASELGSVSSLVKLGMIYYKGGEGVDKNVKKAIQYFEKASELGNVDSFLHLAGIYQRDPNEKDLSKSLFYYEKASKLGRVVFNHNELGFNNFNDIQKSSFDVHSTPSLKINQNSIFV